MQHSLKERLAMLNMDEAARELNTTLAGLRGLVESGQLRCFRLGAFGERVRFIRCNLQAYQRQRQPAALTRGGDQR